jgi:uncharacterized protein YggU (UPF0235/DUF167 family)
MEKGALADLRVPGADIPVRVTPKASRNRVVREGTQIRVYVTTVPEGGKATKEVVKLLARAIGVPKSSLTLVRGATSRDKVFRLEK